MLWEFRTGTSGNSKAQKVDQMRVTCVHRPYFFGGMPRMSFFRFSTLSLLSLLISVHMCLLWFISFTFDTSSIERLFQSILDVSLSIPSRNSAQYWSASLLSLGVYLGMSVSTVLWRISLFTSI